MMTLIYIILKIPSQLYIVDDLNSSALIQAKVFVI